MDACEDRRIQFELKQGRVGYDDYCRSIIMLIVLTMMSIMFVRFFEIDVVIDDYNSYSVERDDDDSYFVDKDDDFDDNYDVHKVK
jgi:hypothetical protein